jgi:hypothetical protein
MDKLWTSSKKWKDLTAMSWLLLKIGQQQSREVSNITAKKINNSNNSQAE